MTWMNRDYQGLTALLQRLQIPVVIQVHQNSGSLPQSIAQTVTPVAIGDFMLWPIMAGECWLAHPDSGCWAYLNPHAQQIELWPPFNLQEERFFWHSFLVMTVAFYLSEQGYTPWHGAGLQDPQGRSWLFGGYSHGGKSTLTIGLLAAGWRYLSDDLLFLANQGEQVNAYGWQGISVLDPILGETYEHLQSH
jgi:hypothetical protein